MIHIEDKRIREHLLDGNFGLEMERLRVMEDGYLSHTPDPFPEDEHIVKDFCENQTEINTGVHQSPEDVLSELRSHTKRLIQKIKEQSDSEYLWLFSNPPYIRKEGDIPVAVFEGTQRSKTLYRNYLSEKYGRYKMTLSGIHVNYSFADDLLKMDYRYEKDLEYREYKDRLYLNVAAGLLKYGWIMVALTAASPLLDSSYLEKGRIGETVFSGMGSVRCSELGYWNEFVPILNYSSIKDYANSIQSYVEEGLISAPSELYYPIRIKSCGENSLENLIRLGVSHIELRMFDLNPLEPDGVDIRDIRFAQLLILWLACQNHLPFGTLQQVSGIQNYKKAARYDLKTVYIKQPAGDKMMSVASAGRNVLLQMEDFYADFPEEIHEIIRYELAKFEEAQYRYAWIIRREYENGFVEKGIELAKKRQVI